MIMSSMWGGQKSEEGRVVLDEGIMDIYFGHCMLENGQPASATGSRKETCVNLYEKASRVAPHLAATGFRKVQGFQE